MSSFSSNESGKLFVASVVLVLMCGSAAGSRFMKATESYAVDSPPPPVVPWWKHPPPPPLRITWPPPVHHYVRHPPSPPPPPPVTDDDSTPPPSTSPPPSPRPSRLHQSPPPPPDEDRTALNGQHSRRLSSIDETGSNQLLVHTDSAPGQCSTDPGALAPGAPPRSTEVPYGGGGGGGGGGYVPVGAPFSAPVMSPVPAPESGGETNLPPPSGDNSTMAHTTMVSAMQYNQCTYTIITSTGNIEGAGTQADVNVEFFDKYGSSVLFVNLRSQSRNFNQGATDTFTVVGDCIQHICKMHLSHDDAGPNPGWFVNTVTVSLLYQTHVFNVFEWLAKDEPPYSLSRVVSSCPA